jgi:hypothetical protein
MSNIMYACATSVPEGDPIFISACQVFATENIPSLWSLEAVYLHLKSEHNIMHNQVTIVEDRSFKNSIQWKYICYIKGTGEKFTVWIKHLGNM